MTTLVTHPPVKKPDLDQIYNDPVTQLQLDLFERFSKNRLDEAGLKEFLATLPATAAEERAKVEAFLADPTQHVDINLQAPGASLAWAAALGFIKTTQDKAMHHPLWDKLTRQPDLRMALSYAARYIDLSVTNRNATLDWGAPGSWFYFNPQKNHINIDMFHTLLLGFAPAPAPGMRATPNAIGVMMHEIGHAQLTTRFSDAMQALHDREKKIIENAKKRLPPESGKKKPKLTKDEYKQLCRIRMEHQLRFRVMNAMEDNCVNRYAANQSREFPHDFGGALNVCNVVLQGTGAYIRTNEKAGRGHSNFEEILKKLTAGIDAQKVVDAQQALQQVSMAVMNAFYSTNGLFDTQDTTAWKRIGIDPDTISAVDGSGFDALMQSCIGPQGVANLQPGLRDRWLLPHIFKGIVESSAERRMKIIDAVWDKYAAHHAKIIMDAAEKQAEMDMQNKGGQGNNGRNGQGNSENDEFEVEDVGGMSAGEATPESPEDARNRENEQHEQNNEENENLDKKTIRDHVKDAKEDEKKRAKEAAKNEGEHEGPGAKGGAADSETGKGGNPTDLSNKHEDLAERRKKVKLRELSRRSWTDFNRRAHELNPHVEAVTREFIYIRKAQKHEVRTVSKELEPLPRGGDLRQRLDLRAHMNLQAKIASGQKVEAIDLHRWKKDNIIVEPTSVEIFAFADGSGSTRLPFADGGRRIDAGLQAMAILMLAAQRAEMEVYTSIWENHGLHTLSRPGMSAKDIGINFDAVKDASGCGSIYNTPIPEMMKTLSKMGTRPDGTPKRFAGMTHFLWVVDGTKNSLDIEETADMLIKLFKLGPPVSLDIAYMGSYETCETKEIVELVKKAVPGAAIGTLVAPRAHDAPLLLVRQLKQRMARSSTGLKAIPDQQKRDAFLRVYKAMVAKKPKPPSPTE